MKLVLRDFQLEAVDELVRKLRQASADAATGDGQAVGLTSPTGSGKTAIATAAIERLIEGDDMVAGNPLATFLWITDQPELNEQTRRKMLATSNVLGQDRLVVIDASFDEEHLQPGRVYFLNIQKLGKEKYLVTRGDDRTYTIWETVANTIERRGGNLLVIVDEAHRGMSESAVARQEALTIVQKFIKGQPAELPPAPVILGVSATLERFQSLLQGTNRTTRIVTVDPEDVRRSGLIKEVLTLYNPTKDQPNDMTMLRAAARDLRRIADRWAAYCAKQGETEVRPILVVQVQDASATAPSKTDLSETLSAIDDEIGPLDPSAFAHAFQEGARLAVGDRAIRYLSPSSIQDDQDVRIVFFKTSLNTGWDCPRAEVMMSFRAANDATAIAQLVGRMVRTPLAHRVDADEELNSVALYLPHYDPAELEKVKARLTTADPDGLPQMDVRDGTEYRALARADDKARCFEVLEIVPSYVIPRNRPTSEVRRLMRLAHRLANDDIRPSALDDAVGTLLLQLRSEFQTLNMNLGFRNALDSMGTVEVEKRRVNFGLGVEDDSRLNYELSAENVDDLLSAAGRKFPEGLHKAYVKYRVQVDHVAIRVAKFEIAALGGEPSTVAAVERAARNMVRDWLDEYRRQIPAVPEARRREYDEIRQMATELEWFVLVAPDAITVPVSATTWRDHLYTDASGSYPATLTSWERQVIEEDSARADFAGWLRNPPRKPWALRVPYELEGLRAMYPDFLLFRNERGDVVVDILDPHLLEMADAPAKAKGLADYAAKHGHLFGRIELVIVRDKLIRRIDLRDEEKRRRVQAVTSNQHLRLLYESG